MNQSVILDASVLMASVLEEPGHERIHELDEPAFVSAVNMAEARSRLLDKGMEVDDIETSLHFINKIVVDFTDADAALSAQLRGATRKAGLSLGDRACLALAMATGGKALTTDRAWTALELPVAVELIR